MTPTDAQQRTLIPVTPVEPTGTRHGSRSYLTCLFRCGNACDHPEPNTSGNPHVQDEIARSVGRRSVLRGAAVGGGALMLAGFGGPGALSAAAVGPGAGKGGQLARVVFEPVAPNTADDVVVPAGFRSTVVMRWGDPVEAGAPVFDAHQQSVAAAEKQFGFNCDYVGVLPLTRSTALLVVNHEYTRGGAMFPAGVHEPEEQIAIEMANHGMSVVRIQRGGEAWQPVPPSRSTENRRIHNNTEFELAGPAAGDARLKTSYDPTGRRVRGTLNNCAGGTTPWGTVLSGEENFNQYFGSSGNLDSRYTDGYARYGIRGGTARNWQSVDPRFDLTDEPHEPHRFGWVVELDPYDPTSTPRKHTMLGRFKHEGANVILSESGHAVTYMGDDERGDYLYKFVSADTYVEGDKARNMELLTRGTLHVARLTGDGTDDNEYDGTGEWIPLCSDTTSYVDGMSVADVLIFTRLAADQVVPTRMDRPEDVEPNPVNGRIYAALTNNSRRGSSWAPDEANPLSSSHVRSNPAAPLVETSGNRNGYVLEMIEDGGDHTATTFTWSLFLVCGDPEAPETWFGGFDKSQVSPISCPDNVAFDSAGNLWVSTDGNALGGNDGVFRVPVAGPERGRVQCFTTVPKGAEACGPLLTDRDRMLWIAVQHPGEVSGSSFDDPASTWPHTDAFARPSVVVVHPV